MRHRVWLVSSACFAIALAVAWWFYARPVAQPDQKTLAIAEDEVYEAVVRELVKSRNGQPQVSQLVFDNSVDNFLCPGVARESCEEGVHKRLLNATGGTLREETISDFLKKSRIAGPLSTRFHTDLPRAFIDRNTVYFDLVPVQPSRQKDFILFYPGANGIISLSHVGFDPALREAIVSSSVVCGTLCGTGQRHVLRKKLGKWVVVDSWVVWVS